jgi:hypothetical protein
VTGMGLLCPMFLAIMGHRSPICPLFSYVYSLCLSNSLYNIGHGNNLECELMASLVRAPNYGESEEQFWRRLVPPEEDRRLLTAIPGRSGYRWFRAANITPLEKYRRPTAKTGDQRAA